MKYRSEIDGLRAIAVLSVLGFHLGPLAGGFVGVDIFFVISGYLISTIILDEISSGSFSLSGFYERRARRILPALTVMLAACLFVALWCLPPADTQSVSWSIAAAALSASNMFFAAHTGYFENTASTQPLLHTWSLGVEEQFYLVFPILLLLFRKQLKMDVRWISLVVFVLSLGLSTYGAFNNDAAGFYLLQNRAWELALGTIVALNMIPIRGQRAQQVAALLGLAAIIGSIVLLDRYKPLPGVVLLPACAGAALIIASGSRNVTARLLSLRPVVFVGLISYSLYLWHWPIIVFQRSVWLLYWGESRWIERVVVIVLSFVLAYSSWRFVEQPFRTRGWRPTRSTLFAGAGASVLAVSVLSSTVALTHGVPEFRPSRNGRYVEYLRYDTSVSYRRDVCFLEEFLGPDLDARQCLHIDPKKLNVLILGDSHAAHLWWGLSHAFESVNFLQATSSSCRPTLQYAVKSYPRCRKLITDMLQNFLPHHPSIVVALSGAWGDGMERDVFSTIEMLKKNGHRVVLFGPAVAYDIELPRLLDLAVILKRPDLISGHIQISARNLDKKFQERASADGVMYVSTSDLLCGETGCTPLSGGVPVEFDAAHLTAEGSLLVARRMKAGGFTFLSAR